jgi:TonB family protein
MSAAKLLILENRLGQKVRTFAVDSRNMNLVFLKESRRIEAVADVKSLDDEGIEYTLLSKVSVASLEKEPLKIAGLGNLRLMSASAVNSPSYYLPEEQDDEQMFLMMKKSGMGHIVGVALLMIGSWISTRYFSEKEIEPTLVTITIPKPKPEVVKPAPVPHVKVSQKKIKPTNKVYKPVVQKKVLKTRPYKVNTAKATNVQRVGALAALGGLAKGTKGYEGLDMNSMKNIRSAGTGNGGGGIGATGSGGVKGLMPGSGLIAGSAGSGGRAESAGGYGTRGTGGGRAGYGKISLVGGMSAVSLPLDDEATVSGGLTQDQIQAVINKNLGQVTYCYEKGLQAKPGIGGRVSVDFTIGSNGRITTLKIGQSSMGSKFVESCMLAKMKNWQFPRPVGKVNVDVLYPFELNRVSSR